MKLAFLTRKQNPRQHFDSAYKMKQEQQADRNSMTIDIIKVEM